MYVFGRSELKLSPRLAPCFGSSCSPIHEGSAQSLSLFACFLLALLGEERVVGFALCASRHALLRVFERDRGGRSSKACCPCPGSF